jgi:uncharacterized protein
MLLWLIPLLIVVIFIAGGYYFARILVYPAARTYDDSLNATIEDGFLSEKGWEVLPKEQVRIPSPFGYDLHGYFLPNGSAQRTVIVSHGFTCNLINSYKYAQVFHNLGFNTLIYDHRNHGKSGGQNTTYGYYEVDDLRAAIDWLQKNKPGTELIGIHGESMGAAIGLLAAARDERVAFMVADCGYASLVDQVGDVARKDYHLPFFPIVPLIFYWARLLTGMKVEKIEPEEAITQVKAPVLIIHGEADVYVDPTHAHRLALADPENPRPLWMAPDAGHAKALVKNRAAYQAEVARFLKEHQLLS